MEPISVGDAVNGFLLSFGIARKEALGDVGHA